VAYTATGASDKIEAPIGRKVEGVGAYFLSFQTILLSFFLSFFLTMTSLSITSETDSVERLTAIMRGSERTTAKVAPVGIIAMAKAVGECEVKGAGCGIWAYNPEDDEMIEVCQTGARRTCYAAYHFVMKNKSKVIAKADYARDKARMTLEKRRLAKGGK